MFHGCGEITPQKPEGLAEKWFFIKAQCGNTSPAATLPFGGMSVAPYSGGYPTGYGNHTMNYHSKPRTFEQGKKLLGFAHLQQSGTGSIGFYYNYALTTPKYDTSPIRREALNEIATPGYYTCHLEDIKCELTADNRTAIHRYTFGKNKGKILIDFSNNGLDFDDGLQDKIKDIVISSVDSKTATATIKAEGVNLYFAVSGAKYIAENNKIIFCDFGTEAEIKVSLSLRGKEQALEYLNNSLDFDATKEKAEEIWEKALSKIKIDTKDEKIKRIFYSNLYHSLVKPCDRKDENFISSKHGDFMVDFATLWDMYKTALPLIFMLYKDTGEAVVNSLLTLCNDLGNIPNSIGISRNFEDHAGQARTLGCYALMTAYRYGVNIDPDKMLKAIATDIFAPDKTDFTLEGKCKSNTWMLDMADCCALAMEIAKEKGETEIAKKLEPLALQWKKCYSKETGLLSEDSTYYEGTLYNYSFRQMVSMDERIEIAGGKENFVKLLDKFFGYGQPAVTQPVAPDKEEYINETMKRGIFEGFNNESDTEAPFSYIYAGRQDRTCEIIRMGMKYNFTEGPGGIPGNNDSGALSSYYVFMALGLFPVAGQNLFLIGSPLVDKAEIILFNGNKLNIIVNNNSDENIYVKNVKFNDIIITDYKITAHELMQGGTLTFEMTGENKNV